MTAAQLSASNVRAFALGGNATLTLESVKTGARYTYKIKASDDGKLSFVQVLTGSDNEDGFAYLGLIRAERYSRGVKSKIGADAPSARAFAWAWEHIAAGSIPPALNVWHEGRCARCNRKLTVPESIASGFGPECTRRADLAKAA